MQKRRFLLLALVVMLVLNLGCNVNEEEVAHGAHVLITAIEIANKLQPPASTLPDGKVNVYFRNYLLFNICSIVLYEPVTATIAANRAWPSGEFPPGGTETLRTLPGNYDIGGKDCFGNSIDSSGTLRVDILHNAFRIDPSP